MNHDATDTSSDRSGQDLTIEGRPRRDDGGGSGEAAERRFLAVMEELEAAPSFARSRHRQTAVAAAQELLQDEDGVELLARHAHRFDAAGLLDDGPWRDPSRLVAALVTGSFSARVKAPYPVLETLSCLRVLAIAEGRAENEHMAEAEAKDFLEQVLALNLDHLFDAQTEARRRPSDHEGLFGPEVAHRLFHYIARTLPGSDLVSCVVEEIDEICAQRPIWTHHVRRMIRLLGRLPGADDHPDPRVQRYRDAIEGPTPLARANPDRIDYRVALRKAAAASPDVVDQEIDGLAMSLRGTGLACAQHAVLVRHLLREDPHRVPEALGLDPRGRAEFEANHEFAVQLARFAIHPSTAQTLYGFARLLERGLLSREDVASGLRRLMEVDLLPEVQKTLLATRDSRDGISANAVLVAGTARVLGQPLGIGQGENPTCQTARGLSIWSQHRPGYLLEIITSAARDGTVTMWFEGEQLSSANLGEGLVQKLDPDLDPVSLILVPHLDRLYEAMMQRTAVRPEDGHKWVNPTMYGRMVPSGFAAVFDKMTSAVTHFEDFIRRFYATHHPEYNGGHDLMFPNPVGILITSAQGDLLGFHAVTIQRVGRDVPLVGEAEKAAPEPDDSPASATDEGDEADERRDVPPTNAAAAPTPPTAPGATTPADEAPTQETTKTLDDGDGAACDLTYRVYFYNPNNESRQDWGQGIRVSVTKHGEREGECSLPFEAFASRLYAFHYNPFEEGDPYAVPDEDIARVRRLAKGSWGRSYPWNEGVVTGAGLFGAGGSGKDDAEGKKVPRNGAGGTLPY